MPDAEIVTVTVEGALTRTDDQGSERPVTEQEFDDCFERIAAVIYEDASISNQMLWGQASTGNLEISFSHDASEDPRAIIPRIMEAAGLRSVDRTRPATMTHYLDPTTLRFPSMGSPAIRIGALSERVAAIHP